MEVSISAAPGQRVDRARGCGKRTPLWAPGEATVQQGGGRAGRGRTSQGGKVCVRAPPALLTRRTPAPAFRGGRVACESSSLRLTCCAPSCRGGQSRRTVACGWRRRPSGSAPPAPHPPPTAAPSPAAPPPRCLYAGRSLPHALLRLAEHGVVSEVLAGQTRHLRALGPHHRQLGPGPVKPVHEWDAGGNLQVGHVRVVHPIDGLHDGADGVAVRHHEHALALPQVAHDLVLPHRQAPRDRVPKRLPTRDGHRREAAVALLPPQVARLASRAVGVVHRVAGRRGDERAPPRSHPRMPKVPARLLVRAAGEGAVAALVEPPVLVHGDVDQRQLLEQEPGGLHRALQHRRVRHVERVAALQQRPRCQADLLLARLTQRRIRPPREPAAPVPLRVPMPHEDQRARRLRSTAAEPRRQSECTRRLQVQQQQQHRRRPPHASRSTKTFFLRVRARF
eukprot:scaffold6106_cov102-Isochrysis_galbana.AAC.1